MRLLFLCVVSLVFAPLVAVDLFGGAGADGKLRDGELPLAEQKQLYQELFAEIDAAARSSKQRMALAIKLKGHYAEPDFLRMRSFLIERMQDLVERSKTRESYDIQIFLFHERFDGRDISHKERRGLIALLELYLKKVDREAGETVVKEIVQQLNLNARLAVANADYETAVDDYKTLNKWLKKTGDKEGAQFAKNAASYIDAYIDDQERFTKDLAAARAKPDDLKLQETVGRFYVGDARWAEAVTFLQKCGAKVLADIAKSAANEDASADDKGLCVVNIRKALEDRSNRKDARLRRSLLNLGMRLKAELDSRKDNLGAAMQMKYTLASADWPKQLEDLGPDYLQGMEVADSSSSVDELRLTRMGWEPLFDHKSLSLVASDQQKPEFAQIKNGILVIKKPAGNAPVALKSFPSLSEYKALKIRVKYIGRSYSFFTVSNGWSKESPTARMVTRDSAVGFSRGYAKEYGVFDIPAGEWVDMTMTWDGKTVTATLNGKEYEKRAEFPAAFPVSASFFLGGVEDAMEAHIQCVMALKKN